MALRTAAAGAAGAEARLVGGPGQPAGSPCAIVPAMTPKIDLPIDELRRYHPELATPPDLEQFWTRTLDEARDHLLEATFTAQESPLRTVEVFDVTFSGYAGQRVSAWLCCPARAPRGCRRSCSSPATAGTGGCRTSR
jgi:Acetyl xylan esterase (AXE1)